MEQVETLEHMQTRHRRELKDLQGRITNKKKNANKKTRKGVNDECAAMERDVKERQAVEVASLTGQTGAEVLQQEEEEEEEEEEAKTSGLQKVEDKVEEKLVKVAEKLHLTSSEESSATTGTAAAAATTTDGSLSTQQPGKKRNRQKERLARRAAEQEAAAEKAEEEASHMTDNRARESTYMKKMFETHNLVEKDIQPDGHCLFSAVADQLHQNAILLEAGVPAGAGAVGGGIGSANVGGKGDYKIVRKAATTYMLEHADDFAPFLEEPLEPYAHKMLETAEWGGQLELMALARRYQVEIRVVQDGRMEKIGEEEGKNSGKTLWLAYYRHGYGLGEHYNSLRTAA